MSALVYLGFMANFVFNMFLQISWMLFLAKMYKVYEDIYGEQIFISVIRV